MDNSNNTTLATASNVENGAPLDNATDKTLLAYSEIDGNELPATAINIFRQLEDFAGFLGNMAIQTRMHVYRIGKVVHTYAVENKCKTREQIITSLTIDLHAYAKRSNTPVEHYTVNANAIRDCLLAFEQKKIANELGVFRTWANATSKAEAQRILDVAANKPERKEPAKKTVYERVLRMVREDLHYQKSLEALSCECIAKLKHEAELSVVFYTVAHKLAIIEDKQRDAQRIEKMASTEKPGKKAK